MRSMMSLEKLAETANNAGKVVLGIDLKGFITRVREVPRYVRTMREYQRAAAGGPFPLRLRNAKPFLVDHLGGAGSVSGHYFFQDLWAARKIFERRPKVHFDIGSRLDSFVAHVLTFMPVTVIDIRPIDGQVPGLSFIQQDATALAGIADGSIDSLSTLHAVEHFGLGRYGDPIDPDACFKVMRSLRRVLAPGGRLYFSVPIGIQRVEFNGQRVFAPSTVLDAFGELDLVSFSAVNDRGVLVSDASPGDFGAARYACGLFEFTK